jgi:CrcB protein
MKLLAYACAGGAIGAGARYLVYIGIARFIGGNAMFPWATLCVNVVGSFLMGALIESLALKFQASLEVRTLLATGVLGGFTTFSAFSLDFVTLMSRKESLFAGVYLASSVCLSILALYAGLTLMRQVLT